VQSIYFGGGTPSLFPAELIDRFLSTARACLDLAPGIEVTLETNPGTIEHDSFSSYQQAGINRVSLGVQSFDDEALRSLGRIHSQREVEDCLQALKVSGIKNFNIDLMFALPGQSLEKAKKDIKLAIASEPAHISYYQLTLEPNTEFAAYPPTLPTDDQAWDIQQIGLDMLETAEFGQYEISAFARQDMQCQHNLNYWKFGDFLAIGAGAHGKITMAGDGNILRYAKHRHPNQYLHGAHSGDWQAEKRILNEEDLIFEFFLNGLRLKHGFGIEDFSARTGLSWDIVDSRVQEAVDRGLLELRNKRVGITGLGWKFVNDIQQMFLP